MRNCSGIWGDMCWDERVDAMRKRTVIESCRVLYNNRSVV